MHRASPRRRLAIALSGAVLAVAFGGPAEAVNIGVVATADPVVEGFSGAFEPQRLGTRSEPSTVRVTNGDVLPLEIGAMRLEFFDDPHGTEGEDGVAAFSVTTDCPGAVLLPGASCVAQVRFAPHRPGMSTAALRVDHDGVSGQFTVHLTGTGVMGMFIAGALGEVLTLGEARSQGDLSHVAIDTPVLGMASTPSGAGYWLVQADGSVHAFGDAPDLGFPALPPERFVVGMAATPSGAGYWLAGDDGTVYAFGDAAHHGSAEGEINPEAFVAGISATPGGGGYWLLDTAGAVYAFGDATYFGAPAGLPPRYAITSMAPTPTGQGYWIIDEEGGIFAYGDAKGFPSETLDPYSYADQNFFIAVEASPTGQGIWYTDLRGGVRAQGDARYGFSGRGGYSAYGLAPESVVVDLAVDVRPFAPFPGAGTVEIVPGRDGPRLPPQVCDAGGCPPAPAPPDVPPGVMPSIPGAGSR